MASHEKKYYAGPSGWIPSAVMVTILISIVEMVSTSPQSRGFPVGLLLVGILVSIFLVVLAHPLYSMPLVISGSRIRFGVFWKRHERDLALASKIELLGKVGRPHLVTIAWNGTELTVARHMDGRKVTRALQAAAMGELERDPNWEMSERKESRGRHYRQTFTRKSRQDDS